MTTPDTRLSTSSLTLHLEREPDTLTLTDTVSGRLLLRTRPTVLLLPVLDGGPVPVTLESVRADGRSIILGYHGGQLEEFTVTISAPEGEDALDFAASFIPAADTQLNQLRLFPAGTQLNFFEAFNFRNRHHTARTAPELPLGGKGCETDTGSTDWQFAPHASALILQAAETALFCGAIDLPTAFGLHFAAQGYTLRHWHLDYGAAPHGQRLEKGRRFVSPRLRLFNRAGRSPQELHAEYAAMLVRAGSIDDPGSKPRAAWWREPLYCTWVDQCLGTDIQVVDALQAQASAAGYASAVSCLNEALVEKALAVIERERLPFRTVLLDDGWQVARGQWQPHPDRFPNLRRLVDRLHAKGFKVVVWWNWAEIHAQAEVDPAHLAGRDWRNRHGARVRDYSSPVTQEGYLQPLFRQLFSPEPGCYDLDGVKTDFLADKVHPDMPLHDPAWRGEENYFVRVTRLFHREMRRHKPDAVHIGASGHPWVAGWVDINRTYDVHGANWREHEERAKMLAATAPGCPVAYDFHQYIDFLPAWFASARSQRASVEIGNVLWTKEDRFAPVRPADSRYWQLLRDGLGANSAV